MKRLGLGGTAGLLIPIVAITLILTTSVWSQDTAEKQQSAPPAVLAAPGSVLFDYQGQLTNASGAPINDPALPMTFRLYDMASGGTACWSESHAVDVQDGLFNVLLGQVTAIDPDVCLANDVYLELVVNGETLSPRELLTSVAHAVEASTLTAGATTRGDMHVSGVLSVNGEDTSKIAGSLQVGNNSWMPTFAQMDGNDLAVEGEIEQHGLGGARFTKIGVNTDPGTSSGTILTTGAIKLATATGGESSLTTPNGYPGIRLKSNTNNYTADIWRGESGLAIGVHDSSSAAPVRVNIKNDGKVGIGTTNPDAKLHVAGGVRVDGNLTLDGTCSLASATDVPGGDQLVAAPDDCTAGSIISGAYVEANLLTPEERRAKRVERFEQGDLLCWSPAAERLELCSRANDRLVMAVADSNGKPIVIGAEPVKVRGPVQVGDILVSSHVPGHAVVNNNPRPGTVIGQALEKSDDDWGLIRTMVRKW